MTIKSDDYTKKYEKEFGEYDNLVKNHDSLLEQGTEIDFDFKLYEFGTLKFPSSLFKVINVIMNGFCWMTAFVKARINRNFYYYFLNLIFFNVEGIIHEKISEYRYEIAQELDKLQITPVSKKIFSNTLGLGKKEEQKFGGDDEFEVFSKLFGINIVTFKKEDEKTFYINQCNFFLIKSILIL